MRIRNRTAHLQTHGFKRRRRAGDSQRRVHGVLINSTTSAPKGVRQYQALQDYSGIELRRFPNLVDTYV